MAQIDNSAELTHESAALLEVLSRRSPLGEAELAKALGQFIDLSSVSVSVLCEEAQLNGWIEILKSGWVLTDKGAKNSFSFP